MTRRAIDHCNASNIAGGWLGYCRISCLKGCWFARTYLCVRGVALLITCKQIDIPRRLFGSKVLQGCLYFVMETVGV